MSNAFVHLRVHSEFSLADGIVRIDDLIKAALRHNMPAVAVADLGNLFAAVKFYQAAVAAGIKPILGADLWLENPADPHKPYRLVLLCQNQEGYRQLCRLLTRAYVEGAKYLEPGTPVAIVEDVVTSGNTRPCAFALLNLRIRSIPATMLPH